jgi:polyketide cyclase/dehydrase/lipid transport protein
LTDLKYHYLWNPQVQSISPSQGKLELDSRYRTTSTVLGVRIASHNHITTFAPNQELEMENTTGLVHYRANFRLLPKGAHTLVICTTTVTADSQAFAFAAPILRRLARRELQTDMQALKLAVEGRLRP